MPSHRTPIVHHLVRLTLSLGLLAAILIDYTPAASTAPSFPATDLTALHAAPAPDATSDPAASLSFALSILPAASLAPADPSDLDAAPDATADLTTTLPVTATSDYSVTVSGKLPDATAATSRVELAHARLEAAGLKTELVVVSPASTGVALAIYRDLRLRRYRSTTGPDEGIDTHSLDCFPACVFVPYQEVNVLTVDRWAAVLRHEYRHVIQAANNPAMAADFRNGPSGIFTSYGLFSEVCADYGIYVAPGYRAYARMTFLKRILGSSRQPLIDQACQGSKPSYDTVVLTYNRLRRSTRAFAALFPRYR